MGLEIETKIKVDDVSPTRSLLGALSAVPAGIQHQRDTFFDYPDRSLYLRDCGLRLREQSGPGGRQYWLCFKGPRQESHIKEREEIEVAVTDPAAARTFLEALGFAAMLVVEKNRELFRLDKCDICLDNVASLGTFVEIEGPDTMAVDAATAKLDLANQPHCPQSYAAMLAEKAGMK